MSNGETHRAFVVDASVWVSRFTGVEDRYNTSRIWLGERIRDRVTMVVPSIALPELGGALARRVGTEEPARRAVRLMFQIPGIRVVTIGDALGRLSAQVAVENRLRGADSIYVALAHRLGVPLVTWDKQQMDRAGPLALAMSPWAPE
ncbi:MAG: type II toxin-antitoxin system VapC family toxin [Chloroflexota bacterium]